LGQRKRFYEALKEIFSDDRRLNDINRTLVAQRQEHETELVQRAAVISALESRVAEVLAALVSEQKRLEGILSEKESVIAYRQSARWWLKLPWVRMKLLFARSR